MSPRKLLVVFSGVVVAGGLLLPAEAQGPPPTVNRDSPVLRDFGKRVEDYVKLHKTARTQVQSLKPTNSPEQIEGHERMLAHRIRELRREKPSANIQGNIFTPEIAAEFRHLIGSTMQTSEAHPIHQSLKHAEPVRALPIRVNGAYPAGVPLQSTPPSLLLSLPPLPSEVEYRVVGHDLILRDIEANLIVDFMGNAIP